jgi:hypothetical protein
MYFPYESKNVFHWQKTGDANIVQYVADKPWERPWGAYRSLPSTTPCTHASSTCRRARSAGWRSMREGDMDAIDREIEALRPAAGWTVTTCVCDM